MPRQRFAHQVIGAIRARAVVRDLTNAMLPLTILAKQLEVQYVSRHLRPVHPFFRHTL
jgi:hypothetical protein